MYLDVPGVICLTLNHSISSVRECFFAKIQHGAVKIFPCILVVFIEITAVAVVSQGHHFIMDNLPYAQ